MATLIYMRASLPPIFADEIIDAGPYLARANIDDSCDNNANTHRVAKELRCIRSLTFRDEERPTVWTELVIIEVINVSDLSNQQKVIHIDVVS